MNRLINNGLVIPFEYKKSGNFIFNEDKNIFGAKSLEKFPIGYVFEKEIDGKNYKLKVIKYRYINDDVIAITVDDAK